MKILIIKTSAIGDVLQAFPVLEELRAHFPQAQIDWIVEKPLASLLENTQALSHTLVVDTKKWRRRPWCCRKEILQFIRALRRTHYDVVLDLQGNAKSGFFTLFAKAKVKVGYSYRCLPEKINGLFTNSRIAVPKELDVRGRYLFVARAFFGLSPLPQRKPEINSKSATSSNTLMVCFGSNWKNKQLTDEQLLELLSKIENYCDPHFLFIYGNSSEEKTARALEHRFAKGRALGGLSLPDWRKKMEEVDLVLAMDSAALHLAATTPTPTFSLFGPSSMQAYKPTGDHHGALQGPCPYGVKMDKRCPRLRTCSTGSCLRKLDPEAIFLAMQKMLDRFLHV